MYGPQLRNDLIIRQLCTLILHQPRPQNMAHNILPSASSFFHHRRAVRDELQEDLLRHRIRLWTLCQRLALEHFVLYQGHFVCCQDSSLPTNRKERSRAERRSEAKREGREEKETGRERTLRTWSNLPPTGASFKTHRINRMGTYCSAESAASCTGVGVPNVSRLRVSSLIWLGSRQEARWVSSKSWAKGRRDLKGKRKNRRKGRRKSKATRKEQERRTAH